MEMSATSQAVPGTETVAGEHDIQLQLLAAIEQAVRDNLAFDDVVALLDQLIDYTNVHFHSEELMMRLYAFPQYEAHQAEHAELMGEVRSIRDGFHAQHQSDLLATVSELRDWLQRHMDGKDRGFMTFMSRLGASPPIEETQS